MNNTELVHHGIKGQRWGIRRFQNKDGSLISAGKRKGSDNADSDRKQKEIASRKADVKNRRIMSDAELSKKIERLRMERQLKDLTEEDISPGKKFVSDVLSSSGKKVATAVAAGTFAYAMKVAMTKEFDFKEAASYIASNPNKKK